MRSSSTLSAQYPLITDPRRTLTTARDSASTPITLTSATTFLGLSGRRAESSPALIGRTISKISPTARCIPGGEHDGCPVEADVDQQKLIERSSSAKCEPTDSQHLGATGLPPKGVRDEQPDIHRIMRFLGERIPPLLEKRPRCNDAELRSARLHNPPHLLKPDEEREYDARLGLALVRKEPRLISK